MTPTLHFGPTRVRLLPAGSLVAIPGGRVIRSRPHPTESYAATARRLGYGADTDAMARQHDAVHAALAAWLQIGGSPVLYSVAGIPTGDEPLHALEEDAVLALTAFANAAGVDLEGWLRRVGG